MLRIGAMNVMLHGVEFPNIMYKDSLSEQNKDTEKFTLVLANPPFKGSLDYDSLSADLLKVTKTKKTELLFVSLMLRMLKKGGRVAIIVPDGVLFGSSKAHKSLREEIVENHQLHALFLCLVVCSNLMQEYLQQLWYLQKLVQVVLIKFGSMICKQMDYL